MDANTYWEACPVLVDDKPRWLLRKYHTDGIKRFRDSHGNFATLDELQAAIDHLESPAVRIAAKEAE